MAGGGSLSLERLTGEFHMDGGVGGVDAQPVGQVAQLIVQIAAAVGGGGGNLVLVPGGRDVSLDGAVGGAQADIRAVDPVGLDRGVGGPGRRRWRR